ncbi:hypothetical protein MBR_02713, partial [Metarhizium brunneum ARSEF 3297]
MPKYTSSILTPAPARSPRQCTSRRSRLSNTTFIAIPNPPTDSTPGVNSMRALWIQQFCHPYDNAPPTPASPSRPPPFAGNSTTRTSKMQPTVALGLNILMCICICAASTPNNTSSNSATAATSLGPHTTYATGSRMDRSPWLPAAQSRLCT